jgi:hypothetical protein
MHGFAQVDEFGDKRAPVGNSSVEEGQRKMKQAKTVAKTGRRLRGERRTERPARAKRVRKLTAEQPAAGQGTLEVAPAEVAEEAGSASAPEQAELNGSPDWSKIDSFDATSLEGRWRLEHWSVVRELARANYQQVKYYTSDRGGKMSLADAIKLASAELGEGALDEELKQICSFAVDSLSWYQLDQLFRANPDYAEQIWEDVKDFALADFKTGHFAAELFERTDWQKNVWPRAHFVAIFQGMVDEWKPRGAIEMTMVEVLAVNYFLYRYWVMEHLQRTKSEPRRESWDYQEWRKGRKVSYEAGGRRAERACSGQYTEGAWDVPYQSEADAIQQAAELADRFRRAYQSQLRSIRDWRRYGAPVVINNWEQVNIAANGGQQINAVKAER